MIVALFAFSLGGCASEGDSASEALIGGGQEIAAIDVRDLSSGVAAEVGDANIGENAITAYISNFRYAQELQDDDAWGRWIYENDYSIDALRRDTIEMFVNQELIRQGAEQEGLTVSDEEVDAKISEARGDATDAEFAQSLDSQAMTEDYYRETVRVGLLQEKLTEKAVGGNDVGDETLLEYLKMYYPNEVDKDARSLEGIDEEHVKTVRDLLANYNGSQALSDWLQGLRDKVGVVISGMPDNLPYFVDLAPYEEEASFVSTPNETDGEGIDNSGTADEGGE